MSSRNLTVAPDTRLLHIGPPKTGTTYLQGAFHLARAELAAHGVVYAGRRRQCAHAAAAMVGLNLDKGGAVPGREHWDELCGEVAEAGDRRVVISSEYFANADDDTARTVVRALGGENVHVVVTLRPFAKILPSQWQQYVQNGMRHSYEEWLQGVFGKKRTMNQSRGFWRRHRHDALVERWASVVGPERLTVYVSEESDPARQLRFFEALTGLPDGLLVPDELDNRSLTLGEAELIRQLNQAAHEQDWSDELYVRVVRYIVRQWTQQGHRPGDGASRVTTPEWALDAATKLAEEMAAGISALGVRIVGDPGSLAKRPTTQASTGPAVVPTTAAAEAVIGGMLASRPGRRPDDPIQSLRKPTAVKDRPVAQVDAKTLLRVIGGRGLRRLGLLREDPAV